MLLFPSSFFLLSFLYLPTFSCRLGKAAFLPSQSPPRHVPTSTIHRRHPSHPPASQSSRPSHHRHQTVIVVATSLSPPISLPFPNFLPCPVLRANPCAPARCLMTYHKHQTSPTPIPGQVCRCQVLALALSERNEARLNVQLCVNLGVQAL